MTTRTAPLPARRPPPGGAGRVLLACTELPLAAGPPQTVCLDASEALGNFSGAFAHLAPISGALNLARPGSVIQCRGCGWMTTGTAPLPARRPPPGGAAAQSRGRASERGQAPGGGWPPARSCRWPPGRRGRPASMRARRSPAAASSGGRPGADGGNPQRGCSPTKFPSKLRTSPLPETVDLCAMRQVAHSCVTLRHSCARKDAEIAAFGRLFGPKSAVESPKS
jgi:hypothetical protein